MSILFDWDKNKAKSNLIKHKVSFEEAESVFYDDFARIFPDIDHSDDEHREIIFGYSNNNRLLIVNFTIRNERSLYENYY